MRTIQAAQITDVVRRLCIRANCHLTEDVKNCICQCRSHPSPCPPIPWAIHATRRAGITHTISSSCFGESSNDNSRHQSPRAHSLGRRRE